MTRLLHLACRSAALVAATVALLAAPAFAASPQERISRMVAQLDAETLEDRDAATEALVMFNGDLEALLPEAVDLQALSPEQRARLNGVMERRFVRTPRGGLGVQFAAQAAAGVPLVRVLDDFPASAHLKAGDVLRRVEGRSLLGLQTREAQDVLRHHIISHDPGERLSVQVLRDGHTLDLTVPVGDYRRLGNAAAIDPRDYQAAWEIRRRRIGLGFDEGPILTPPASQAEWPTLDERVEEARRPLRIGLVVGGRTGPLPPLTREFRRAAARQLRNHGGGAQLRVPGQEAAIQARLDEARDEELQRLLAAIAQWERQRAQAVAMLESENVVENENQLELWRNYLGEVDNRLDSLRRRLAMIQQER